MGSEITVAVGVAGLVLGIGAAILTFGRSEGRRDQMLTDHEARLKHHANKISDAQETGRATDIRVTTLEQTLCHMNTLLSEVRDDVKQLLKGRSDS